MAKIELKLPQMGESVAEATLTTWLKEIGDKIELDEPVFEIATDKVDSEVPSEVAGILVEKRFDVDDVIAVGDVVAVIETSATNEIEVSDTYLEELSPEENEESATDDNFWNAAESAAMLSQDIEQVKETMVNSPAHSTMVSNRFYSPLVQNIAKQEGIAQSELDSIKGSGLEGRVTKDDIMAYVSQKTQLQKAKVSLDIQEKDTQTISGTEETIIAQPAAMAQPVKQLSDTQARPIVEAVKKTDEVRVKDNPNEEIIPLSRMGKMVAKHMRESLATSAHVQSFVEVDVTNVVKWREKVKQAFEKREGEKFTFTPIFMEAVAVALKKYPLLNASFDGENLIRKKQINLGMAAALPDGNLIVPVIKNADQLNLTGMSKQVNDLAKRARENKLKPDEVMDGTYTVTNVGSFGSVFGTPIINQPQIGILALGAIRKEPAVIETAEGDFIAIRSKMFLSHSYDHRVVNGALGGMFAKAVADYLEDWDMDREI